MAADDTLILLGVIGAAHGIKGEVRIKAFTGDPLAIADYGPLTDDKGRASRSPKCARPRRSWSPGSRASPAARRPRASTASTLRRA